MYATVEMSVPDGHYFLTYEMEFVLFLAKIPSCLWAETAYTRTKCDVSCLQTLLTRKLPNDFRSWPSFFPLIGKKNNQTSVSDADREIPTLGSPDNAGKLVNLVALSVYLRVGISRSASVTDV